VVLRSALLISFCSRIEAIADLSGCPSQHRMEELSKLCKPDIAHCRPEKANEQGQLAFDSLDSFRKSLSFSLKGLFHLPTWGRHLDRRIMMVGEEGRS
jgi:hypothetical protein